MEKKQLSLKTIGRRMRRSRQRKNVTEAEMAEALGKTHGIVSKYESGQVDVPATSLIKYGQKLDYEPKNYLAWEGEEAEDVLFLLEQAAVKPEKEKQKESFDPNESISSGNLPDEVIDMAHAYKLLSDSQCDFEILEPLRNEIIGLIETKTEMSKESLMRRLMAYLDVLRDNEV